MERAQYKCHTVDVIKMAEILETLYREYTCASEYEYDAQWAGKICARIAKWLTDSSAKPGLIISGGVGTGKTTLTKALSSLFFSCNINYFRLSAIDIAQNVLQNRDFFDRYICGGRMCDFLIIDDLGIEDVTVSDYGNTLTPFPILVNSRYERGLPLILTTNLITEEIAQRYGERTEDRLKQMCERITMDRESFRK